MPISENVGGVLRTHSVEREVIDGVTVEKNSVAVNDGGVMRKIHSASVGAATVEGITPKVAAEDHIVIVENGTFTLSAPAGARIIVGGAAKGTSGGNVAEYTLESDIKNAQCTLQCGAVNSGNATTLTIDGVTYNSGSTKQIIQSKWGPIGGEGGSFQNSSNYHVEDGTGAGGGGGARKYENQYYSNGKGGNVGGYGNFGGSGGYSAAPPTVIGGDGASGKGGNPPYSISECGGGGGGFSAGGGTSGLVSGSGGYGSSAYYGEGGAGIIVIEW